MRIFNLELKNIGPFKSAACTFRDEDDEGGNVTIITGLNGTGKSVIIDAIRSLLLGPYSTEIERNIIQDKNDFLIKASVNYGQKTFELIGNQLYHDRGIQTNDIDLHLDYLRSRELTKFHDILIDIQKKQIAEGGRQMSSEELEKLQSFANRARPFSLMFKRLLQKHSLF